MKKISGPVVEKEDGKAIKPTNMPVSSSSEVTSTLASTVISVSACVVNTSSTTVSVTTRSGATVHSTTASVTPSPSSSAIKNPALAAVVAALRSSSLEKGSTGLKDKASHGTSNDLLKIRRFLLFICVTLNTVLTVTIQ